LGSPGGGQENKKDQKEGARGGSHWPSVRWRLEQGWVGNVDEEHGESYNVKKGLSSAYRFITVYVPFLNAVEELQAPRHSV